MIVIGVTGKYCSGKSYVTSLFNLPTVDVE